MTFIIKIREVALGRGITTAYQLQKLASLSPSTAYRLFHNNVFQIELGTLSKLCEALDCEPSDLLVRPQRKAKVTSGE